MGKRVFYTTPLKDLFLKPRDPEHVKHYEAALTNYANAAVKELREAGVKKVFVEGFCEGGDMGEFLKENAWDRNMVLLAKLRDEGFEIIPLEDPELYSKAKAAFSALMGETEEGKESDYAKRLFSGDIPYEEDVTMQHIDYLMKKLNNGIKEDETALFVIDSVITANAVTSKVMPGMEKLPLRASSVFMQSTSIMEHFEAKIAKIEEAVYDRYSHLELMEESKEDDEFYKAMKQGYDEMRNMIEDFRESMNSEELDFEAKYDLLKEVLKRFKEQGEEMKKMLKKFRSSPEK